MMKGKSYCEMRKGRNNFSPEIGRVANQSIRNVNEDPDSTSATTTTIRQPLFSTYSTRCRREKHEIKQGIEKAARVRWKDDEPSVEHQKIPISCIRQQLVAIAAANFPFT
jgi:hypothetical protein